MSNPEQMPVEQPALSTAPTIMSTPRWSSIDLVAFGGFFGITVFFLPSMLVTLMQLFSPGLRVSELTAVQQVVVQGIIDFVLVGYIFFIVRIVRGEPFLPTLRWFRKYEFANSLLLVLGAVLAISVVVVSALFPPNQPPPIERLISSRPALYAFAIFGVGFAPLLEEIIFRGFVFAVLDDVGGSAIAVPATAALFALLHVPQLWGSWAGISLIFGVGYVLSYVRGRSGSLIPSFIIHIAYNGTLFGLFAVSTLTQKPA